MKKKFLLLFLIINFIIFPYNVLAYGSVTVSTTKLNLVKGNNTSFKVVANNAAGNVLVTTSNPSVATISTNSFWIENQSITVNVKGLNPGTSVITVTLNDVSTFDEEPLSATYQINVVVSEKQIVNTLPPNNYVDTRSSNTNISSIKVNNISPEKKDNKYILEMGNYVEEIEIEVVPEDSKSKVIGIGKQKLNGLENKFNITVTAENGKTETHEIIINKRKHNLLSEIDFLLSKDSDIEFSISKDDKITEKLIEKIIEKKKKITLNKYSSDDKVLYSWILDGNIISKNFQFNPNIEKVIVSEEIEKAFNYAEGIYLDLSNFQFIENGITLKYFIEEKYDNTNTNLYVYDELNKNINKITNNVKIENNYINIENPTASKYFISKTRINNNINNNIKKCESKDSKTLKYVCIMQLLIVIFTLICLFMCYRKNKKLEKLLNSNNN